MVETFCLIQTHTGTEPARIVYAYLAPKSLGAENICAAGIFELVTQLPWPGRHCTYPAWIEYAFEAATNAGNITIAEYIWNKKPNFKLSSELLNTLGGHADALPLIRVMMTTTRYDVHECAPWLAFIGLIHDVPELVRENAPHIVYGPDKLIKFMSGKFKLKLTEAELITLIARWPNASPAYAHLSPKNED